jgi:biopolymer transport protein ExbB
VCFTVLVIVFLAAQPVLAAEEEMAHRSFFSKFFTTDNAVGTFLIWVCLVFSICIFALIGTNILSLRGSTYLPPELAETLERLISEKNFREAIEVANGDTSPFGQVMQKALGEAPRGYTAMEMAIEEVADVMGNGKIRKLVWLELAGAAGPMIGLFGTVFGMIIAFYELVGAGGAPKPAQLAGGIATALVCTLWGLIVGIPGVVTASLFKVMVEGRTAEVIHRAKELIAPLRPGAAKPKPAAAPAAASPKPTT